MTSDRAVASIRQFKISIINNEFARANLTFSRPLFVSSMSSKTETCKRRRAIESQSVYACQHDNILSPKALVLTKKTIFLSSSLDVHQAAPHAAAHSNVPPVTI